jgi:hypothetical protein
MSSPPSPASVAVHVVDADVPLEVTVQVGDPPFLKCGLAATADCALKVTANKTEKRITSRRRMAVPFVERV